MLYTFTLALAGVVGLSDGAGVRPRLGRTNFRSHSEPPIQEMEMPEQQLDYVLVPKALAHTTDQLAKDFQGYSLSALEIITEREEDEEHSNQKEHPPMNKPIMDEDEVDRSADDFVDAAPKNSNNRIINDPKPFSSVFLDSQMAMSIQTPGWIRLKAESEESENRAIIEQAQLQEMDHLREEIYDEMDKLPHQWTHPLAMQIDEDIRQCVSNGRTNQRMEEAKQSMAQAKADQQWQPTFEEMRQREHSKEFSAAQSFTKDIHDGRKHGLSESQEIGVKIWDEIVKDLGMKGAVFFDGSNPDMMGLKDDFDKVSYFMDNTRNQGFVLSLHSDNPDERAIMQTCIDEGISHPKLDQIRLKLARAHGLGNDRTKIQMIAVFKGSDCFKYTVDDVDAQTVDDEALKQQFSQFKSAKIHPLLYRPTFDINNFDSAGDKSFGSWFSTHSFSIGPDGLKKRYTQPSGWTRYGLSVLGKYDSDTWIHPFNKKDIWWKAYHGTSQARKAGFHPADAIANIAFKQGFHVSQNGKDLGGTGKSRAVYGDGVYCATSPDQAYYATSELVLKGKKRRFDYVIMCAVKPSSDGIKTVNFGRWWVVKDKRDIRPYGILVREHGWFNAWF